MPMLPAPIADLVLRLRHDFRLSILTIFGLCAVVAIMPFGVLRLTQGLWLAAAIDFTIVVGIFGSTVHAWRGGNLEVAGLGITLTNTAGGMASVAILGQPGLYWLFPAVLANFFLVRPRVAWGTAIVAVVLSQFQSAAFTSLTQRFSVAVPLFLVALFAYIFAVRTTSQRVALEDIATLDPLTGTRNRRAMEEELAIAINAHQRSGRPIALAMLDLDHFKTVNDRFGHEEGDRVLQDFVALVQHSTRATDRLFRFGGEEFVLLMDHTDEVALERAFGNLLRRVRDTLRVRGEPLTVSVGAAVLRHGDDRDTWLARADAALYRAKQGGRNRLEIAGDAP